MRKYIPASYMDSFEEPEEDYSENIGQLYWGYFQITTTNIARKLPRKSSRNVSGNGLQFAIKFVEEISEEFIQKVFPKIQNFRKINFLPRKP